MMSILITGGCGFVGSNLAIFLKKKLKCQITSLDNLSRNGSILNLKRLEKNGIKNINRNISSKMAFSKLKKFDLIIDCCAEAAVEYSKNNANRVFNTNLVGTFNVLEKVKQDNAKIIFISTSRVYSIDKINEIFKKKINLKKKIINEKFSVDSPISIYGFTKLASEILIKEYSYLDNIKYIINRCGVISGPWQFGKADQGFVTFFLWRYLNDKSITFKGYNGSGEQIRDVLHINDFNSLILKQVRNIDKINNETFNVGGGLVSYTSLKNLSILCEKISKNKLEIKKIKESSNYDIPFYISDISKVLKIYDWKPKNNFRKILNDNFLWQKNNMKILNKYFR